MHYRIRAASDCNGAAAPLLSPAPGRLVWLVWLVLLIWCTACAPAWADQLVRVGVYQNSPKVAYSSSGKAEGIFIDLIEAIAKKEGWQLEYVPGTWNEGLERLSAGQIDLMPDVALNAERELLFAFPREPALSSWSQIYARRGSGIRSLLDLEGRRVAVLEGSVQQDAFDQMVAGFSLSVTLQSHPDFAAAFRSVAQGQADAVVTNRFFGVRNASAFGLEDTAIIFGPARLYFAAPKRGNTALLAAIDKDLGEFKKDSSSIYYRSLRRWASEDVRTVTPAWLIGAVLAFLLLLLASGAWVVLLRRQVAAKTSEISRRSDEIMVINRTLRATGSQRELCAVLDEAIKGALALTGFDGAALCVGDGQCALRRVGAQMDACQGCGTAGDGATGGICPALLAGAIQAKGHVLVPAASSPAKGDVRWHAFFPLTVQERTIGVLCLFSRRIEEPDAHVLDLVGDLCGPVALAMENARLYEEAREQAHGLEQRVAERTDELAQANIDLLAAKQAAESADRLKSAFLATMSHELRTPLNSIIGFTGIVLQGLAGPLNGEQQKQLGMVRDSARHLLALINDVLDISKIEAGELGIAAEPFDLPASIHRVVAIVTPLANKKHLSLAVEVSQDIGTMVGDARRVEQILLNLLGNAIKFSEAGSVTLEAAVVADFKVGEAAVPCLAVRLRISDTGIGIKPEDMALLFTPFRQVDSALSRKHDGTGLGLAICQRLTGLMAGRIEVESHWQQGSTFTVTLPLHPPTTQEPT